MWFLPSYGRPNCFDRLINSPGGMPDDVVVVVNEDDPERAAYEANVPPNWHLVFCPPGRFTDAWRWIYAQYPELDFYGMWGDDHVAQTPKWWETLKAEAGLRYLAYPNGKNTEFPLMRGVCAIGGDLVRALGWVVPHGFLHNFVDVILDHVCRDTGLLRACPEIYVDHEHWRFVSGIEKDFTYQRGSADQQQDAQRYFVWLNSMDRFETHRRLTQWIATWPSVRAPVQ